MTLKLFHGCKVRPETSSRTMELPINSSPEGTVEIGSVESGESKPLVPFNNLLVPNSNGGGDGKDE